MLSKGCSRSSRLWRLCRRIRALCLTGYLKIDPIWVARETTTADFRQVDFKLVLHCLKPWTRKESNTELRELLDLCEDDWISNERPEQFDPILLRCIQYILDDHSREGRGHIRNALFALKFYFLETKNKAYLLQRAMFGSVSLKPFRRRTLWPNDLTLCVVYYSQRIGQFGMSQAVQISFGCSLIMKEIRSLTNRYSNFVSKHHIGRHVLLSEKMTTAYQSFSDPFETVRIPFSRHCSSLKKEDNRIFPLSRNHFWARFQGIMRE